MEAAPQGSPGHLLCQCWCHISSPAPRCWACGHPAFQGRQKITVSRAAECWKFYFPTAWIWECGWSCLYDTLISLIRQMCILRSKISPTGRFFFFPFDLQSAFVNSSLLQQICHKNRVVCSCLCCFGINHFSLHPAGLRECVWQQQPLPLIARAGNVNDPPHSGGKRQQVLSLKGCGRGKSQSSSPRPAVPPLWYHWPNYILCWTGI